MTRKDGLIPIIKKNAALSVPITESAHLYTDLGFDSLSFITMLTEIEDAYGITFGITEMEGCLQVGQLFKTVTFKLKEGGGSDQAFAGGQEQLG